MIEKLEKLVETATGEREFYDGSYYRIKSKDEGYLVIERAVPGYCGDHTPHPAITFKLTEDALAYRYYSDYESQPIQNFFVDKENLAYVSEQMTKLVNDYYKVKFNA